LRPGEGQFFAVRLDEVLTNLRPDEFEEKAEVRQHGVVAADRMSGL